MGNLKTNMTKEEWWDLVDSVRNQPLESHSDKVIDIMNDDKDAKASMDRICSAAGIKNNFVLVQCNTTGTCVAIEKDGDPYILYDNIFLNKLKNLNYGFTEKKIINKKSTINDWEALTILSHELGHHQNQHFSKLVRSTYSVKDLELQADEFAGGVMFKLGATLSQGEKIYYSDFVPISATLEHPGRTDRINSFEKGYQNESNKNTSTNTNTGPDAFKNMLLGSWINNTGLIITFYENGNAYISSNEKSNKTSWTLLGSKLNINYSDTKPGYEATIINVNNYTLTIKDKQNESPEVFQRTSIDAISNTSNYINNNWKKLVFIENFNFNYRPIGGITDVNIPLMNNTDYFLNSVKVKIDYIKDSQFASGDIYKTEYIEFLNISPHTKLFKKAPDSDRGTKINYSIISIKSEELNYN
jgi:hypothetical protein